MLHFKGKLRRACDRAPCSRPVLPPGRCWKPTRQLLETQLPPPPRASTSPLGYAAILAA